MQQLPSHLKKYVVEQNYEKYTSIDQACWRYILRQLRAFLSRHAHECYLEGLEKTGIEIDRIPRIEEISQKLEKFGWRALPVSGFIPPAAFMELQSLSVLPIASDMRTLEHLSYTPAPDIVHEAAGHAPILVNQDFADYLKKYAEVAKHAIISKEDLDIYEAIRVLSDLKESPSSTAEQIKNAQKHLEELNRKTSHVSEASELGRMNWWTAEYGLIGDIESPKIFGAGLLSSVGESKWCLSSQVKKIPLSLDCIKQTYDITEPQPQLYVTPDFKTLSSVLEQMSEQMAYKTGGISGLEKAIKAQSVNSVQLNSGIQISGVISEVIKDTQGQIAYLKVSGPTQLCESSRELPNHSKKYHSHGFGTPVGFLKGHEGKCLSQMTDQEMVDLGLIENQKVKLSYTSGVTIEGDFKSKLRGKSHLLLLTFENCTVSLTTNEGSKVLFAPEWGTFDMAVGHHVVSVFGGPADRISYGEIEDFPAHKVQAPKWTAEQLEVQNLYSEIRNIREVKSANSSERILDVSKKLDSKFPNEWLPRLELIEILEEQKNSVESTKELVAHLKASLQTLAKREPRYKQVIEDGLHLVTPA